MTRRGSKSNLLPKAKVKVPLTAVRQPKLVRKIPEGLSLEYTDALMIQQKDTMFFLTFLQTQYPLVITPAEIQEIKEVEQRCVAQLAISPDQMARNLRVLNKNFDEFIKVQSPENQKHLKDLLNGKEEDDDNS